MPGVEDWVTVPKVPVLVPPDRLKLKALLARPVMAFPAASSTTIVTASVVLDVFVDDAKLTEDLMPLIAPGVTWTCG